MWEGQDGRKSPGRSPGALAEVPQEGIGWIVGDPREGSPAQPSAAALSRTHVHCYTNKTRHQQTKERALINNLRLKTRRQPKSPLTRTDKEDAVHTCNGIRCIHADNGLLLSHRNKEIIPFPATCMDPDILTLSEVDQKQKDR